MASLKFWFWHLQGVYKGGRRGYGVVIGLGVGVYAFWDVRIIMSMVALSCRNQHKKFVGYVLVNAESFRRWFLVSIR